MNGTRTIFAGAVLATAEGCRNGSVAVRDGIIESVGDVTPQAGDRVVDCSGLCIMPGLVDIHVHLREPGYEYKETIASGTAAAAHGGYTTVCPMPNLNPVPDSLQTLGVQLDIIARTAAVRTVPYASITLGRRGGGQTVDFDALAPSVVGFSDDGSGVQERETMRRAMEGAAKAGKPIVAHCEVDELLRGGYIHDGEYCRRHGHRGICSESEWAQVVRDIELAAETGCQYHVCHVSAAESVEAVRRGKAAGVRVSCETAPHYLLLCDDDLQEDGSFKMNPPLRSASDREALIRGIQDGTIEVIATDHAPHSAEEKSRGLEKSVMGIVGLECAFALMYTYLVKRGVITLEKLVALMSENPRRIMSLGGGLRAGEPADIAVFDLGSKYRIDPGEFLSEGKATPFAGWDVEGACVLTLVGGRAAYSDGRLDSEMREISK
ncbi:MAG: dihydroorotase [Alistipes sp.]|nr:dihydroorotase [Alistipes sp.]